MDQKYINDKSGNHVLPITHENSVRDSQGTPLSTKLSALESALLEEKDYAPATYSGMGRKVLQKNMVGGVNTLTQSMMPVATGGNTVYVIKYDYVLGEDITIPANCVLEFDGGSISAGSSSNMNTITGQNTNLSGILINAFGNTVSLEGEWDFNSISPDWFIGTELQKVQKAIDVSHANRSVQIDINRSYDLTGGTIYIDRGYHDPDESSIYSRRNLIISGTGEGRFIKRDAGYMFSAHSGSVDILFTGIHFKGHLTDQNDITTIVDMKVFDCHVLYFLSVINCSFCHCGCVYYQDNNTLGTMQSIVSIDNIYSLNKCVFKANKSQNTKFISDTFEDGITAFDLYSAESAVSDLKIIACCIEGFYMANTAAINLYHTSNGISITDCYFEANYCSIKIDSAVSGSISGNIFHSRSSRENSNTVLHCIELASVTNLTVTENRIVVTDPNMYLFYFNVNSSQFEGNAKFVIAGNNSSASPNTLVFADYGDASLNRLVKAKVVYLDNLVGLINEYNGDKVDIRQDVANTYTQITGGSIFLTRFRGMNTITLVNLTVSDAITGGSYTGKTSDLIPVGAHGYNGAIEDYNNQKVGTIFITDGGNLGLRIPAAGTYNGCITYPFQ